MEELLLLRSRKAPRLPPEGVRERLVRRANLVAMEAAEAATVAPAEAEAVIAAPVEAVEAVVAIVAVEAEAATAVAVEAEAGTEAVDASAVLVVAHALATATYLAARCALSV